jgi:hypothetical protein
MAEPRWNPNGVDKDLPDDDQRGSEGDRSWDVMTPVSCVHAVDSQDGPYPGAFGAELRPGNRAPFMRLDDVAGQEAKRLLEQIERGINEPPPPPSERQGRVTQVPIEEGDVEGYEVISKAEVRRAQRKERLLVADYVKYLGEPPEIVHRHKIDAPDAAGPLYSDIFNKALGQLIEAKANATRGDVRMAIGQLADYGRFIKLAPDRAILLPAKPSQDVIDLLNRQGISAIWREGPGFRDNVGGRFTHDARADAQ